MTLKSKLLIVLVLLVSIASLKIYVSIRKDIVEQTPQIFEIGNTEEVYRGSTSNIVTIRKHYMIINPPEDLHELKLLIEKFPNYQQIENNKLVGEARHFEIYFYRSSKKLPPKWKPKEGYLEDRIEHHRDDLIASIYWSDLKSEKYYNTTSKSKDRSNYGAVLERIEYVDDTIIRRIQGDEK